MCIYVINSNQSFIFQNLKVVGPLQGGNSNFFSPSGFEIQSDFNYRILKFKFYSVRSSKCYLSEKNLIHSRVTATISSLVHRFLERTLVFNSTKQSQVSLEDIISFRIARYKVVSLDVSLFSRVSAVKMMAEVTTFIRHSVCLLDVHLQKASCGKEDNVEQTTSEIT